MVKSTISNEQSNKMNTSQLHNSDPASPPENQPRQDPIQTTNKESATIPPPSDLIHPSIPSALIPPNATVVPISYLQNRDHMRKLDGAVIHLKVLSISSENNKTKNANLKTSYQYGSKKQKGNTNQVGTFNRFTLVADMANPPFCACFFTRTSIETAAIWRLTFGQPIIGSDYYVVEPKSCTQTIGDSLPVLDLDNSPLIPLRSDVAQQDMEDKMSYPRRAGEYRYFLRVGVPIHLGRIKQAEEPSCTGVQCDRQKQRGGCTCLQTNSTHNLVYSMDVILPVPAKLETDQLQVVQGFRSLRTTRIWFLDLDDYAARIEADQDNENRYDHRTKINNMVTYINDHHGWTILGWYKLGELTDAADGINEKAENFVITMHISYLYPSNADVEHSEEFNKLKIN